MNDDYKIGFFIEECKNRFICLVQVDNEIEECYVSSSSKLSNFINLTNQTVLLKKNKGKNLRTKYTLHAMIKNDITLLNLNFVNDIVNDNFFSNQIDWKREHIFSNNLKTDYFNEKEKIVIEVKALLSDKEDVIFPSLYSERTLRQLKEYNKLLKKDYNVKYYIILMSNNIQNVHINSKDKQFKKLFNLCKKNGLELHFFNLIWNKNYEVSLIENLNITIA